MKRGGRVLVRFWRRLRRPSLARLVTASLVLHLGAILVALWVLTPPTPRPSRPSEPLVVELPPAEAGRPLVRPEKPSRTRRSAPSPPVVAARPTPPPLSQPAPARPEPERTPVPAAPVPPEVARPAEPPAAPPTPPAPPAPTIPEPAPAPPAVAAPAAPAPAPVAPAPAPPAAAPVPAAPPAVAARPPEPAAPAPRGPSAEPAPREAPAESPFGGQAYSLLRPKIELPPLPGPAVPGGGTRPEGEGAGESGSRRDGQVAVPLNTPDPRYADYFPAIKKRIQDNWVYPTEAARRNESGQLVLEFVIRKDGRVPIVDLVRSSGVDVLDRYAMNAVRLAAPFPAFPDRFQIDEIRVSASFSYILDHGGFRLFGLK